MTDYRGNSGFFHRHFSLESFRKFLGPEVLADLARSMGSKRRKRLLGFEGFLWLGLFIAANTTCGSLQSIFQSAATLDSHLLSASIISVSGFCQYRAFFPSEAIAPSLASFNPTSSSSPSQYPTSVAWASSVGR